MAQHEAIPFPWRWGKTEQVPNRHRVGARMSHQQNAATRAFHPPHRQFVLIPRHTSFGEKHLDAKVDAIDEVAYRFAAIESVPAIFRALQPHLGIGLLRLLGWTPRPTRITNLLEPRSDDFLAAEPSEERRCRLAGPGQRRDKNLIEVLIDESISKTLRLMMTQVGERRVTNGQSIAYPLGLTMTDEHDLHRSDGTVPV